MSERAKRYDGLLRRRLSKLFHERCLTTSQIKEFVRAPDRTYRDSVINILLKHGNLVNCMLVTKKDLRKLSLLWIAVLFSCYKLAKLLVRSGADVNELCRLPTYCHLLDLNEKSTVLHALLQMAPSPENERLIRLVTDHGANLQARDSDGQTVLHIAVMENRDNLIEMLLEKGVDLRARDSKGQTALHFAVTEGQRRIAKVLLKKGADVQAKDSKGMTALHLAVTYGQVRMTEMLLKKRADVNTADNEGMTPLLEAARSINNVEKLLLMLIKHGADATARNHRGENILHCLARVRGLRRVDDLVRVLIEKGASLHDREHYYLLQPLHLASQRQNNKMVELYLEHGASVNAKVKDGQFPLSLAAMYAKEPTILKTLLEYGADVNQKTTFTGCSALHMAGYFILDDDERDGECIRLLLSVGADVLAEDKDGYTPLDYIFIPDREPGSRLIVKELALIKAFQPWIELKDEKVIERYPELWNHYRNCIEQVERMKSTRFIETCTLFELLTKCHCQIAALMRNPDFKINFKNYDLSEFSLHAEDIVLAFDRAEKHHQSRLDQEDVIDEAFYHTLPYEIVRSVVHYICDCCENVS